MDEETTGVVDGDDVEIATSEFAELLPRKGVTSVTAKMVQLSQIDGGGGDPPTKDFVENIHRLGILEPLVVCPEGDRFRVIEGGRRLEAARLLGLSPVPVVIEKRPDLNPVAAGLAANFMRSPNFIKDARDVVRLRDEQGWTRKQIAAVTGMKISQIKAAEDMIANLDPRLIAAAEQGRMGKWSSTHAARLEPPYQHMLIELLETKAKLSDNDVINVRKLAQDAELANLPSGLFESPDEGIDVGEALGREPDLVRRYDLTDGGFEEVEAELDEALAQELESAGEPGPKKEVKIGYPQRRLNTRNLLLQAKKEMLAIKSNQRNDDDRDVLSFIEESLERLPEGEE